MICAANCRDSRYTPRAAPFVEPTESLFRLSKREPAVTNALAQNRARIHADVLYLATRPSLNFPYIPLPYSFSSLRWQRISCQGSPLHTYSGDLSQSCGKTLNMYGQIVCAAYCAAILSTAIAPCIH